MILSRLVLTLGLAAAYLVSIPHQAQATTASVIPLCVSHNSEAVQTPGIPAPVQNGQQPAVLPSLGRSIALEDLGFIGKDGEWRCWVRATSGYRYTQMVVQTSIVNNQPLVSGGFFFEKSTLSEAEAAKAVQLLKTLVTRYSKAPRDSMPAINAYIERFVDLAQKGKISPTNTFYPVDETGIFIMYASGSLQISITMP